MTSESAARRRLMRTFHHLLVGVCAMGLACSSGRGSVASGEGGQLGTGSGGSGPAGGSSASGGLRRLAGSGRRRCGAVGGAGAGQSTATGGAPGTGTGGSGAGGSTPGSGGSVAPPPPRNPFNVVTAGAAVDIYVDAADFPAVVRAVGDLQGRRAACLGHAHRRQERDGRAIATAVMVGTLGKSPAIDALAAAGKLDTAGVTGKWESAVIQAVANPVAGVTRALVIAGSDRRGTVYGIYELSQRIGVSPWYWWADVAPTQSTTITVDGAVFKQGEPIGQVPRHLHQRRRKLQHLGGPGRRREEAWPGDLQENLRAALAPQGELHVAGDAPGLRRIQQVPRERRQRRCLRHRDGVVAPRDDVAEQRQRVGPVGRALMDRPRTTTASIHTPFTTTGTPAFKRTASTKTATPWACAANMTAAWWP